MNYTNYMLFDGFWGGGAVDVWPSMGAASMHNMSGLSRAMHVHVFERHVQCINPIPRL